MRFLIVLFICAVFISCEKDVLVESTTSEKTHKTIIIGSSIASGIGASTYSYSWAALLANYNSSDSVINLSRPGYLTFHYLPSNNAAAPILPDTEVNVTKVIRSKPDIVIISLTTNDISRGYTPSTYMSNLKIITDSLEKNSIRYLVTSATLRNDFSAAQKDSAFAICKYLRSTYSASTYIEIMSTIADTSSLKINSSYYSSDLIHPNNAGHLAIFERLQPLYLKLR